MTGLVILADLVLTDEACPGQCIRQPSKTVKSCRAIGNANGRSWTVHDENEGTGTRGDRLDRLDRLHPLNPLDPLDLCPIAINSLANRALMSLAGPRRDPHRSNLV